MTNNYAVRIKHGEVPYIFCITDSQTTASHGRAKRSGTPKLIQHGHNLVMPAGRGDIIYRVYAQLSKKDVSGATAQDLAELISKEIEALAPRIPNDNDVTSFLVAGKDREDKQKLSMYEIRIESCKEHGKEQSFHPIEHGNYAAGSGAGHVLGALQRDNETGFFTWPSTPLEAMLHLIVVAKKAGDDIGVDEKLQFGFVTPSAVRVLHAPGVEYLSTAHGNTYLQSLTNVPGVLTEEMEANLYAADVKPARERYIAISRTLDEFYLVLETQMHRLLNRDFRANDAHTQLKAGKASIADYERAIAERKSEYDAAQPIVDAFIQGGIENIVTAIRQFNTRQTTFHERALESATVSPPPNPA